MDLPEAYQILEVPFGASKQEVRQSYKDLQKVWHPDRHASDPPLQRRAEERLKRINAAFGLIEDAGFPSRPSPQPVRRHHPSATPPHHEPPRAAPAEARRTYRSPPSVPFSQPTGRPSNSPSNSPGAPSSPNYAVRMVVALTCLGGGLVVSSLCRASTIRTFERSAAAYDRCSTTYAGQRRCRCEKGSRAFYSRINQSRG